MRLIIFIVATCIFAFSCKKEGNNSINSFDGTISIEGMMKNIPAEYQSNQSIVFKNRTGESITLQIEGIFFDHELNDSGNIYNTEAFRVKLSNPDSPDFRCELKVSGNIDPLSGKIVKGIYVDLNPFISITSSTQLSIIFDENDNIFPEEKLHHFYETKSLINNTFSGVFERINEKATSFSEIYYNTKFGIIGFRDAQNDLWEFVRFEEK